MTERERTAVVHAVEALEDGDVDFAADVLLDLLDDVSTNGRHEDSPLEEPA